MYTTLPVTLFLSALLSLSVTPSPPPISKICFSRDGYVFLKDQRSGRVKRLIKGSDPNISPSGRSIAFTHNLGIDAKPNRIIEILDLESATVRALKPLSAYTQSRPLWSPDETRLAFNILIDNRWQVCVAAPTTNEWRILTKGLSQHGVSVCSWTAAGRSVLCQDLLEIYEVDLDSRLIRKIPIDDVVDRYAISSSTRFSISPDEKLLLFDSGAHPDAKCSELAIMVYDFATKTARRIASCGIDPQWLPSGEILFDSPTNDAGMRPRWKVCKTSLDGKIEVLVQNAFDASVSPR